MLPLPAPQKVNASEFASASSFLASKCFRFPKNLTTSTASTFLIAIKKLTTILQIDQPNNIFNRF